MNGILGAQTILYGTSQQLTAVLDDVVCIFLDNGAVTMLPVMSQRGLTVWPAFVNTLNRLTNHLTRQIVRLYAVPTIVPAVGRI